VSDRNAQMTFVCRENIRRYERILHTHLTDLERDFIKKRIAEERRVLESTDGGVFKALYQAPKAVVAIFSSNFVDLSLPFNIVDQVALF
jgi:hypothetical protein